MDEVGDYLAISGALKGVALLGELFKKEFGIDYIAIVGYGDGIIAFAHRHGLGIAFPIGASGGITVMTDGHMATELAERFFGEDLSHQAHPGVNADCPAIGGGNTAAFLTPVLQGKEGKIGKAGYIFIGGINTENAAAFLQLVQLLISGPD